MTTRDRVGVLVGFLAVVVAAQLAGQTVYEIELRGDLSEGDYGFTPDEISARPGDILRFRVGSGAPHSIAFDSTGLARAAKAALNRAMPGRVSQLRGPLLVKEGETYRMVVPRLPSGGYRFYCLTHQVYEAAGTLILPER
jgi:plastocyanin